MRRTKSVRTGQGQLFQWPTEEPISAPETHTPVALQEVARTYQVVLSGSYRKDVLGLKHTFEELKDLGCEVLSPSNIEVESEVEGFVYMKGESVLAPDLIELRHLQAIERSNFVWLHAPEGYVGTSASLEVGFARAAGVPVFSKSEIQDAVLRPFVQIVSSPKDVIELTRSNRLPVPSPALGAFQNYYRRVAMQRGYEKETAKDCLLLMVEEFGELARAARKEENLVRHGKPLKENRSDELADVFLYVVHMANLWNLDLASSIQSKEQKNWDRFLAHLRTISKPG